MSVVITAASAIQLPNLIVPSELSRKLRRADDYIRLAVASAFELLEGGGGENRPNLERTGLVIGSGFSTMQTNFEVLDSVVSGEQTSPTLFSHSVFNAAAGYVASTLSVKGAALTVTDFSFPFFKALQEAHLAILSGRVDTCIVLQVETYSDLLEDGRLRFDKNVLPWIPGVVGLLLERDGRKASVAEIASIDINCHGCEPAAHLSGRQDVISGSDTETVYDPLGTAALFIDNIQQEHSSLPKDFIVRAAWGEVLLHVNKSK